MDNSYQDLGKIRETKILEHDHESKTLFIAPGEDMRQALLNKAMSCLDASIETFGTEVKISELNVIALLLNAIAGKLSHNYEFDICEIFAKYFDVAVELICSGKDPSPEHCAFLEKMNEAVSRVVKKNNKKDNEDKMNPEMFYSFLKEVKALKKNQHHFTFKDLVMNDQNLEVPCQHFGFLIGFVEKFSDTEIIIKFYGAKKFNIIASFDFGLRPSSIDLRWNEAKQEFQPASQALSEMSAGDALRSCFVKIILEGGIFRIETNIPNASIQENVPDLRNGRWPDFIILNQKDLPGKQS